MRPAGRRPRGAPRARRRPAAAASPVEGRAGRGPARRWDHRARHDLPFGGNAGDLRGTEPPARRSSGWPARRRLRAPSSSSARLPVFVSPCSTRSPTPARFPNAAQVLTDTNLVAVEPGVESVHRRGDAGPVGRGGARRRAPPRRPLRRARRVSDEGRRPSAPGCARKPDLPRIGWRPCEPRPGWTSERRRPRRSPSRSSRSWSRSGAAGPSSSPRPGPRPSPASVAGVGLRDRRAGRHRAARSGLRHDRRPRPREASRGARRRRLRVLQPRLPDAVREGSRGVPVGVGRSRAPRVAKETR